MKVKPRVKNICDKCRVIRHHGRVMVIGDNPNTRVRDVAEEELVKIREYVDANIKTEGDLRREIQADIRRKGEIGCYQGLRHRRGLPVHGQRTSTNARTRKGRKKT